jgi:NAD(P)-dependent dehydrogenase (short-subunit alcohol dehydrogenase family)
MGEAVVARLSRDGLVVIGVDRDREGLERLAGITARFVAVATDVRDPGLMAAIEAALDGAGGSLVGVVNLAGASVGDAIERITDEDWDAAFAINATAPMRLCRALVPRLRSTGGGSIVNVSSPVALQGARKVSYAASKAALLGLNAALARALGRDGIRVNAVLPGPTLTRMTADWDEAKQKRIGQSTALGRLCRPEEIAGVVSFLLGPDSSFMTGAVLDVTGGALIGGAM